MEEEAIFSEADEEQAVAVVAAEAVAVAVAAGHLHQGRDRRDHRQVQEDLHHHQRKAGHHKVEKRREVEDDLLVVLKAREVQGVVHREEAEKVHRLAKA